MEETYVSNQNEGEGNRAADRRYRAGVRKTVESTSDEERAEQARDLSPEELREAQAAEKAGMEKAKEHSSKREI
jgi:hypothetical protein